MHRSPYAPFPSFEDVSPHSHNNEVLTPSPHSALSSASNLVLLFEALEFLSRLESQSPSHSMSVSLVESQSQSQLHSQSQQYPH